MQTAHGVAQDVKLGKNVRVYGYVNLYGCTIGDNTIVGSFVEIRKGVVVGKNCKIQAFAFIPEGVILEDEVFVGPHACFINDRVPRATTTHGKLKEESDWHVEKTVVKKRASIGANATIMCGVTIGENSIVGAGSVVTKDVPPNTIVAGVPAKVIRKVSEHE
ncbi:N-acetyltransferase [Candidatus Woesearchaeota archaeon]|nr:N-acetyltransferase [Candidatus Woesearchaeota archaeon]